MDKIELLEKEVYKKFKNELFFIQPSILSVKLEQNLLKANKRFIKKIRNKKKLELINRFTSLIFSDKLEISNSDNANDIPLILDLVKHNLHPKFFNFLVAFYKLHQYRWQKYLPNYAIYSLEFFLPNPKDQKKLQETYKINLPFALLADEKGFFDLASTKFFEEKTHLILSRLSYLPLRIAHQEYFTKELTNFPDWAFFAIHHQKDIAFIAGNITQIIYDELINFLFDQLKRKISPKEAKQNANSYIIEIAKNEKNLERLIVYRWDQPISLSTYILENLALLQQKNPNIKEETLKDFYKHILYKLKEFILAKHYKVQGLFDLKIKKTTDKEYSNYKCDYYIEITLILDSGEILKPVKEFYAITLSDDSIYDLVYLATNKLEYKYYYI